MARDARTRLNSGFALLHSDGLARGWGFVKRYCCEGSPLCSYPVVVVFTLVAAGVSSGITPRELVDQIQASRRQYQTFQAEYEDSISLYTKGVLESEPSEIRRVVWRNRPDKTFGHILHRKSPAVAGVSSIKEQFYTICAKYVRQYQVSESVAHGIIEPGTTDPGILPMTPAMAMWEPFGPKLDEVTNENATVEKDGEGLLNLVATVTNGYVVMKLTVAPSKGYMPIISEFRKKDGTLIKRVELSELKKVDGLWLPFRYVSEAPVAGARVENTVLSARINQPIPDEMLDFAFPDGTPVEDRIAGLLYRVSGNVSEKSAGISFAAFEGKIKAEDLVASQPAAESELVVAAEEAKQQGAAITVHPPSSRLPVVVVLCAAIFLSVVAGIMLRNRG